MVGRIGDICNGHNELCKEKPNRKMAISHLTISQLFNQPQHEQFLAHSPRSPDLIAEMISQVLAGWKF